MDPTERYQVVMGSDVVRDGMFLELWDARSKELAMEAFYSDPEGSFSFEHFRADVPPEVESWFRSEAQRRLPPSPA